MSETTDLAERDYDAPFPVVPAHAPPTPIRAPATYPTEEHAVRATPSMSAIELQMRMAMSFPRDLDLVTMRVAQACKNPEFARSAIYSYTQGRATISGPSIKMAEEIARHWGNINSGFFVVADTPSQRTVRAWAWDMQSNVRKEMDVTFGKQIQRVIDGVTQWVEPDERQLQQLTVLQAQKGVRNMILAMVPSQLQRDALSWCRQTLRSADAKDPDVMRKALITSFATIGVKPDVLRDLAGKGLDEISLPADEKLVEYLRGVHNRVKSGETSLADVIAERAQNLGLEGPVPRTAAELRRRINQQATGA